MHPDEIGLLRRVVGLVARGAVAYKAAYMLSGEDDAEAALRQRCAARYALLERLLDLLAERSTPIGQVRDLLDGIDMDPVRYGGEIDVALADARRSDDGLARLAEAALAAASWTAAIEACLRNLAAQAGSDGSPARISDGIVPKAVVAAAADPIAKPAL